jgi:ESCRT-I complex subunit TSG101
VRALCRRQFFARATGLKVAEVQAATRESGPPPIQPGMSLPYSMVHGDSWTHGAMQAQPPMRSRWGVFTHL